MEQCNRLELELGEIVKCMGGTECEGVCLNMHSIVHMHLCVGAVNNFPFEDHAAADSMHLLSHYANVDRI